MSKIYTMCGLPGSGKSTYAKNYLPDCVIVSSDAIRGELYGSEEIQGNAKKVFAEAFRRIREAVNNGQDVVFDAGIGSLGGALFGGAAGKIGQLLNKGKLQISFL